MLDSFRRPDAPLLTFKPDTELLYIIDNREQYLPESVLGAMAELKNRGTEFTEEEVRVIEEDMQARADIASGGNQGYNGIFTDNYKNCLVEDPDAYEFYSRRVIKVFTFFFGILFGTIMMAMNLARTKDWSGVTLALVAGFGLTIIEFVIGATVGGGSALTFIVAFINVAIIDMLFWNRYIGKATLYKPRKYWVPLIIGIVIYGLLIAAIISTGKF